MKTCPICQRSYENHFTTCPQDDVRLVASRELPPGTLVEGKYRIDRLLGVGGMGIVYLAHHNLLGQPCALKFLSERWASDPKFVQRFLEEARAAVRLHHPNVVLTTDVSQAEDGSFYICMEFVQGLDLRMLLEQNPNGLPVERAVALIKGIASGLGAAHAVGLVHRDVKPENVLVAMRDGRPEIPKIADFGIVARNDGQSRRHTSGLPVLTPEYASPEQWRGVIPSYELDGRTDLYALGVVFFELLTGRLPFSANSYEGWMDQHTRSSPPKPSQLRPELARYPQLDAAVLGLLAKEREARTANVESFLRALETPVIVAPPPVIAPPQVVSPPPIQQYETKSAPRHKYPIVLYPGRAKYVVFLLFSIAMSVGIFVSSSPSSDGAMYYMGITFFPILAVLFLIMLFPGSAYLRLDDEGFTYCALFREHKRRWEEVTGFAVVSLNVSSVQKTVGWVVRPEYQKHKVLSNVNKALVGYDEALPSTYGGKSAQDLARLMNECRQDALR